MEQYAKLLTAVAALVGAVAWPTALFCVAFFFRSELKSILAKVPGIFDRMKKATLPGVAFELEQVATVELETGMDKGGKVTLRQVEAAARIAAQTRDVDTHALLGELDKLCLEYDALRRTLPSGENRTRAMVRVVVKMRALSSSLVEFIDAYKSSGSPGSRLAAIAMMQMNPRVADLGWLEERFSSDQPFLFYHAALTLQIFADSSNTREDKQRVRHVAAQALATIKSFNGVPDQNTVEVLEFLLSSLPE
jgi:hypothetical protein